MYDPNDEIMQRLAGRNRQGLFDRIKQNITNPSGDNAYKAGMLLFGQKPQDDSNDKLATQIALLNYKSQLPQKPNYLLGENGDVTQLPDGRIVQRPFGLTKTAQDRYEGRLEESKADRDSGMAKAGFLPQEQSDNQDGEVSVMIGGKKYVQSRDLAKQKGEQEKLAKVIPDSDKDTLGALGSTINLMSSIKNRVADPTNKLGVDPNSFRYENNALMNEYGKRVMTPEQSQFKADITDATNQYLKAQSGVQRGFKEIEFLKSAFPEPRSKSENFIANAEGVIGRSIAQMDFVVDALRKSGYDTTDFENDLNGYKQKYADLISRYAGDYQSKFRKSQTSQSNADRQSLEAELAQINAELGQ